MKPITQSQFHKEGDQWGWSALGKSLFCKWNLNNSAKERQRETKEEDDVLLFSIDFTPTFLHHQASRFLYALLLS